MNNYSFKNPVLGKRREMYVRWKVRQDHGADQYGQLVVKEVDAALDAGGMCVNWKLQVQVCRILFLYWVNNYSFQVPALEKSMERYVRKLGR